MSVIAPEVAADEQDEETRRIHERWAYDGYFYVAPSKGLDLVADLPRPLAWEADH
jgi:hypothetical protein